VREMPGNTEKGGHCRSNSPDLRNNSIIEYINLIEFGVRNDTTPQTQTTL
jgi:hypothetical protein